jgi:hypothetical protein
VPVPVLVVALADVLAALLEDELFEDDPHAASRRQARSAMSTAGAAVLLFLPVIRDMELLVDDVPATGRLTAMRCAQIL